MKNFIKNKKLFFFFFLGALLIASQVLALELSWPPSPASHILLTESIPLPKLVKYFYEWGIALGGFAAFIALIMAGFQYLTSVGSPVAIKEAKDRIQSAVFGLVLLLGSWLILNTINPELTTLRMPSGISSGLTTLECDTNADCLSGYECTDQNPGDGTKAGVCIIKEGERVTCAQAQIFKGTDYSGESMWINVGEPKEFSARSVKVYTADGKDCCSEDAYKNKNGYYGCGCNLQLFAGGGFLGLGCGDMEAIVPGCEKRIPDYTDKSIKCVKLIGPQPLPEITPPEQLPQE